MHEDKCFHQIKISPELQADFDRIAREREKPCIACKVTNANLIDLWERGYYVSDDKRLWPRHEC
jgi:hypothetical protein